ncbi:helix-turn-helix domain-containing protein [Streptomonospora wellingtoniae]|uniref:Helix-turn-helix transcriptional regulator n=1 Tax=Streptomonospora wellingtoniae TaxID=3075544 RepID=A0ABU2KUG9_9ACTN|nr:helix-turn-helix transcriptional regulator [Streptomonospora sp. DSM 45055]MDT0302773.1 helix-turn-helix transcriptional regulator [Streptomonospora sp. DSM 45055]
MNRDSWKPFGEELRIRRKELGLSVQDAADATGVTPSLVRKQESGDRSVSKRSAENLDELYQANGSVMRSWSAVQKSSGNPEWWRKVEESERRAAEIRMSHPTLIPGALQTEKYTAEIFRVLAPLDGPETQREHVLRKAKRATQMTSAGLPRLWAVIPELVVTRPTGGAGVMLEQCEHLLKLIREDRVRIQVIGESVPVQPGAGGAYRILGFASHRSVLWVEHSSGAVIIDDQAEVRRHEILFGELQGWAYSPIDSREVIEEARDRHGQAMA